MLRNVRNVIIDAVINLKKGLEMRNKCICLLYTSYKDWIDFMIY